MSDKNTDIKLSRRRVLRGTGTAGIIGTVGLSGITSGRVHDNNASGNSLASTTDFDSGGGVEIEQDGTHIALTNVDEGGYSFFGYMHFKLEGVKNTEVSFEITNLEGSRMPADYRLLYTSDLESGSWMRMDEAVGGGFSQVFESDEIYLSGYGAYPYQQTVEKVKNLEVTYPRFVETEVIGQSSDGRDMHAIRITDPNVDDEEKKDIISITRQHPGEVAGSWHMDAAIDYVLETYRNQSTAFTDDFCFHFIPNANPDGIYNGFHRYSPQGYDLNRQWDTESPVEIENMKTYMRENLDCVYWGFDFHASTHCCYDAVIYDERAADEDDLEVIENIASHSLSYPNQFRSGNSDRISYGFLHNEFDATMVITEAWTYHEYSARELAEEGRNFFREVAPRKERRGPPRRIANFLRTGNPSQNKNEVKKFNKGRSTIFN